MRFGISLPNFGHMAQVDGIIEIARKAEELGYSSLWAAERLIVPIPPNQSWSRRDPTAFEPVVTLSYIAGMTERIHLGTAIVILPIRNPVLLARAAASLDVLSGGRFELGVGVGWMREEMRGRREERVLQTRGRELTRFFTLSACGGSVQEEGVTFRLSTFAFRPLKLENKIPQMRKLVSGYQYSTTN